MDRRPIASESWHLINYNLLWKIFCSIVNELVISSIVQKARNTYQ